MRKPGGTAFRETPLFSLPMKPLLRVFPCRLLHGGGWRGGTKNNPPGLAMLKEGVTVASVEYRFSQHAIFPATAK